MGKVGMQAGVLLVICVTVVLTVLSRIGTAKEERNGCRCSSLLLCRRAAMLYHNVIMYRDRPYLAMTTSGSIARVAGVEC